MISKKTCIEVYGQNVYLIRYNDEIRKAINIVLMMKLETHKYSFNSYQSVCARL